MFIYTAEWLCKRVAFINLSLLVIKNDEAFAREYMCVCIYDRFPRGHGKITQYNATVIINK